MLGFKHHDTNVNQKYCFVNHFKVLTLINSQICLYHVCIFVYIIHMYVHIYIYIYIYITYLYLYVYTDEVSAKIAKYSIQ